MKQSYDYQYLPPAPVLWVRLATPEWGLRTEALQAIVDTGADATLVPLEHLRQIQASVGGESGIRSQWGERRMVHWYLAGLTQAVHIWRFNAFKTSI